MVPETATAKSVVASSSCRTRICLSSSGKPAKLFAKFSGSCSGQVTLVQSCGINTQQELEEVSSETVGETIRSDPERVRLIERRNATARRHWSEPMKTDRGRMRVVKHAHANAFL